MSANVINRKTSRKHRVTPALLSLAGVAELLGVGLSTAERLKASGKIGPRPVQFAGPKWRRRELLVWINHPGPDGELLGVFEWPAVWAAYRKVKADRKSR